MPEMRPGQLEPNELELAILDRLADQEASIREHIGGLHVLSRKFTGVGSFTEFACDDSTAANRKLLGLDGLIRMPDVPTGMGAVLFFEGERPKCLETFTYGDEHWDGVYDGFSIESASTP